MKRNAYNQLITWKKSSVRKPLLLQGARQVGKTYLVNQFGKKEYKNYYYFNFEQNTELKSIFEGNLNPENIIKNLGLIISKKIENKNSLIFFDEIQTTPNAITSLKYFQEQANDYHIIAAGSLLGVSIGKTTNFPVGKVNFLTLYPMTFYEYLEAIGQELLVENLSNIKNSDSIPEFIHNKLISELKMYLFLGGMPEVLQSYITKKDITLVRNIQNDILEAYKRDFSKYTDKNQAIKTQEVWRSIPYQLAKENKKFQYSDVKKKSRSSTYEATIEWLKSAGLINVAYNISTPKLPLSGYTDFSKFKIYLSDTGLLGAMLNLSSEIIIEPTSLFSQFNGAFTENFVANELIASSNNENLYYWTSNFDAEVDFIFQKNNTVFPLEVKSGLTKNKKSLKSYTEKYKPTLIFRTSPRNYIKSDNFINIPLYAVSELIKQKDF